ncbi:metallophosphoesterase [Arthrobacter sp. JCM 19049]|uniref:metallophosphoesterase family protein n=1 Tax=Arthrobacter sp. JCM 19049 TaxID=1460643 RepID=UPI000B1A00CA|nr:metallophosphoesterase [Arthrobacter sp. JCM 19049]
MLEELVRLVEERHIDVVLISGDIYDRALPQVDAVKLCNSILGQLRAAGAKVIITSGNHDSAARLGFAAELIDAAGCISLPIPPG